MDLSRTGWIPEGCVTPVSYSAGRCKASLSLDYLFLFKKRRRSEKGR